MVEEARQFLGAWERAWSNLHCGVLFRGLWLTAGCLPPCPVLCRAVLCTQAKGQFLLLDSDLNIKGIWGKEDTAYGYDFW